MPTLRDLHYRVPQILRALPADAGGGEASQRAQKKEALPQFEAA
jgi:hypothetical protein